MWTYNEKTGTNEWACGDLFDTKAKAVAAGRAYHLERTAQIKDPQARRAARAERFAVGYLMAYAPQVDADAVLEQLQNDAVEFAGDDALGWLDHLKDGEKDALQVKLDAVLLEWLREMDQEPRFYSAELMQEYPIEIAAAPSAPVYSLDSLPDLAAVPPVQPATCEYKKPRVLAASVELDAPPCTPGRPAQRRRRRP